ncbi:MAG: YafY family protein [Pseudomonadota bacterium]
MRRTERLFQIIQILRGAKASVTGRALADELEVSLRTLYRDMAELGAQRVPVTGEAGTGYVLDEGYDMPPLMLTPDELDAAALGASWVARHGDPSLAKGARDLMAKLSASVPEELRPIILDNSFRTVSSQPRPEEFFDGAVLRQAIRDRLKLSLHYVDANGAETKRIIWPLFIAYFDHARLIVAWCETREDFRHFRTDNVQSLHIEGHQYPIRRATAIRGWETMMASRRQET